MSHTPITPKPSNVAIGHHSNKPLLVLVYLAMALVIALVVYAIIKSKQAKPRDNRPIIKLGRAFDPSKPVSGALCFVLLFASIGGGYAAYHSYAGTCVSTTSQAEG